jgi:hypothetical protein
MERRALFRRNISVNSVEIRSAARMGNFVALRFAATAGEIKSQQLLRWYYK